MGEFVLVFSEWQVAHPGLTAGALWDRLAVLKRAGKQKGQREGLYVQISWVPGRAETRAILDILYLLCIVALYTILKKQSRLEPQPINKM